MVRFTVPGQPVAKGRPRISTRGGFARAYTPAKTVAYEGLVALAGQTAMCGAPPYAGAVSLEITAVFPIPESWSKRRKADAHWHTSKPDQDNIAKAVGDGLNGVVWKDDSQIASSKVLKVYGETPGLHVVVEAL